MIYFKKTNFNTKIAQVVNKTADTISLVKKN